MASAVAMISGGAVVNALAFTGGKYYSQNWAKAMTLKRKKRDMTRQSYIRSSAGSME